VSELLASGPIAPGLIARSPVRPLEPAVVAGWEVSGRRSTAALTLADHTPLAKVAVRAGAGGAVARALGVPLGRAARDDAGALVIGSGPGEWLVLGPPGEQAALCARLAAMTAGVREPAGAAGEGGAAGAGGAGETAGAGTTAGAGDAAGTGELATVLDLTHGRAVMRLTGADSAATLAKVCGIDLSDRVTPDGAAFRSSVAKLVTDVVRDDRPVATGQPDSAGPSGPGGQPVSGGRVRSYLLHCERSYGQYLFDALLDAGAEFGVDVDGFRAPGL
jgi:sarcosine oxidase gamma subunit